MTELAEYVEGIPVLSGSEEILTNAVDHEKVFLPQSPVNWDNVKSTYAIALHMHQPIIPNPDQPLRQAEEISYLKFMMDHPDIGDNHNATVFRNCYKRMGEFIPSLLPGAKSPASCLTIPAHFFTACARWDWMMYSRICEG